MLIQPLLSHCAVRYPGILLIAVAVARLARPVGPRGAILVASEDQLP